MNKRATTRDLELRVVALEASQEQILTLLGDLRERLGRIEADTTVLKGYVQNVKGGWRTLAVLGGILLGIATLVGAVLKFVRGGA